MLDTSTDKWHVCNCVAFNGLRLSIAQTSLALHSACTIVCTRMLAHPVVH